MSFAVFDAAVHDGRRGVEISLRGYAPAGRGPFPAVVFSHGFGYSRLGYGFLGSELARAGIISLHPTHAGTDAAALLGFADTQAALSFALGRPELWRSRAADVTAVIDAVESDQLAAIQGRCAAARIGVAGHSFGAFTALLVAGARIFVEGREEQHGDPRPRAFCALSPPGLGQRGLQPGSLRDLTRPVLCMYGTRDQGPHQQPPSWRGEAFDDLPPGDKLELVLDGAPHETFANLPEGEVRPDKAHVELVRRAVASFFRAHLCAERAALDELRALQVVRREK